MKQSNFSCSDMCESMNFNTHEVSSDSSTNEYKVNVIGFRHLPRCLSKQFSDVNDSFSIDEFNSNSHKHPEVFKCFKCYGLAEQKDAEVTKKCRECQGTSFVTDSHPLVSILQQIISKQVPQLSSSQQNGKKRKLNRRYTIEQDYAFPDPIKEESFSVMEDQVPTCKNCLQQCEANYHKCDRCPNFYVCVNCYHSNRFSHHHKLQPKEGNSKGELNACYTLNKIVEQIQSLEVSKVQDSKCFSCKKTLQACFVSCSTCSQRGSLFVLCDLCYQNKNYYHQESHQLTIKTSSYDQVFDLNQVNNSMIQFENTPLFRSDDNFSQKLKQASHLSNSVVNLGEGIGVNGSEISQKLPTFSEQSDIQNQLEQLHLEAKTKQKSNLFKSCRNEQQQHQEADFSLRFSQSRDETAQQISFQYLQTPAEVSFKLRHSQHSKNSSQRQINQSREESKCETDRSNPEQYIFKGYRCDICQISPIINKKYRCNLCDDFDLCQECYLHKSSQHQHDDFTLTDGRELRQRQRIIVAKGHQDRMVRQSTHKTIIPKKLMQSKTRKKEVF